MGYQLDQFELDWISGMAESGKALYGETISAYRLWQEYLKRSEKYEQVCRWLEENRPGSLPEKLLMDFNIFVDSFMIFKGFKPPITVESELDSMLQKGVLKSSSIPVHQFYQWALKAGFPFEPEIFVNYFTFGNLYREKEPFRTFRIVLLIRANEEVLVYETSENLDYLLLSAETMFRETMKREPTVKEFQSALKYLLMNDSRLHFTINNPYKNKDDLLAKVSEMIDKQRSSAPDTEEERKVLLKPSRFESFTGPVRVIELERYLKAYDLKKAGMTNKEIAVKIFDGYDPKDPNTIRRVLRDRNNAARIIENVEKGMFPGKYTGSPQNP